MYILVVEDDPLIREAIRDMLTLEGYPVRTATHGREALDVIAQGAKPSLILLDLMMPVVDGWQLMELLAEDSELKGIPIVVISAVGEVGHFKNQQNAIELVQKPFNLAHLLTIVNRHMNKGELCQTGFHLG